MILYEDEGYGGKTKVRLKSMGSISQKEYHTPGNPIFFVTIKLSFRFVSYGWQPK